MVNKTKRKRWNRQILIGDDTGLCLTTLLFSLWIEKQPDPLLSWSSFRRQQKRDANTSIEDEGFQALRQVHVRGKCFKTFCVFVGVAHIFLPPSTSPYTMGFTASYYYFPRFVP